MTDIVNTALRVFFYVASLFGAGVTILIVAFAERPPSEFNRALLLGIVATSALCFIAAQRGRTND